MKRSLMNGVMGALAIMGCLVGAGCGGGGSRDVQGATDLRYLRTAEAPGTIHLTWTPSPEKSLLGYTIRRRHAGEQSYSIVAGGLLQGNSFTDQLPDREEVRTVYYQVIAVSANGSLSAPAEVATVISPPAPPGGF